MDTCDQGLVAAFVAGDNYAFEVLRARYWHRVHSVIRRKLTGRQFDDDVLDLTLEVFCRAIESIHTFIPYRSFELWILAIASNTVTDWFRKRYGKGSASALIKVGDITDVAGLSAQLVNEQASWIAKQILASGGPELTRLLVCDWTASRTHEIENKLLDVLNGWIRARGENHMRRRRLLLQDAFPSQIQEANKDTVREPLSISAQEEHFEQVLVDGGLNPEQIMIAREQDRALEECINKLRPTYKDAVELIDKQEMSYEEAARTLKTTVKRITNWLHRGRLELRKCLAAKGYR